MKPKDKKLLLKDLCARLPYGVKIRSKYGLATLIEIRIIDKKYVITVETFSGKLEVFSKDNIDDCKPYLRSMSSMTEEEERAYRGFLAHALPSQTVEWLDKNHFDHRRDDDGEHLIEKGLAIETPRDMYK